MQFDWKPGKPEITAITAIGVDSRIVIVMLYILISTDNHICLSNCDNCVLGWEIRILN